MTTGTCQHDLFALPSTCSSRSPSYISRAKGQSPLSTCGCKDIQNVEAPEQFKNAFHVVAREISGKWNWPVRTQVNSSLTSL